MAAIPPLAELEEAVRNIVREGRRTGQLSVLTPRIIRSRVEETFRLEPGTLGAKEYKDVLKQIASDEALRAVDDDAETEEHTSKPRLPKKRKSDTQDEPESVKLTKVVKRKSTGAPAVEKPTKTFKSASTIESSDEEEGNAATNVVNAAETACMRTESPSLKTKSGRRSSPAPQNIRPASTPAMKQSTPPPPAAERKQDSPAAPACDEESGSELSALFDEPPKSKKQSKSKDKELPKGKSTSTSRRQKKPAEESSKDEKTINRLKSMVLACGVRKVWTKEFQNIPKPSQQIKRLREILTELGMSGRFTLQQAKAIKEKRELAQELEDVKTFEQMVTSSGTHTKTKPSEASDDESPDEAPVKRKNARKSIMAFLGDQSD